MLFAGIIVAVLLVSVMPAHALDNFYFCTQLVDDECVQFAASLQGLATLEQIGITPEAVAYAFGWGFAGVVFTLMFGVACGLVHSVIVLSTKRETI